MKTKAKLVSRVFGKGKSGIPCLINVLDVTYIPPDRRTWGSDIDYYGGYVPEWEILDRKGYKAAWLGKKLSREDIERIDREVIEWYVGG